MTEQEDMEECKRIAKIIDPDNTFLNECEEAVDWAKKQWQKRKER